MVFRLSLFCLFISLVWSLVACQSQELGVLYQGERIDVVDMHLHTGHWHGIGPSSQRFLAERFPHPIGLNAETIAEAQIQPAGILGELDKAGIRRSVLFAVYAPRTVGITSNENVIENTAADPERLFGFASLPVDSWDERSAEALAQLEQALQHPQMIGVKLAHTHMQFRMDDPAYYSIYSLAGSLNKPVYLHIGPTPFPGAAPEPQYTDPRYLREAIESHPETDFILGHLGFDFIGRKEGTLEDCLELAREFPNVWLEASAMGSETSDPEGEEMTHALTRIRQEGLTARFLYGSDGPQAPGFVDDYLTRSVEAMERAGWTLEEARAGLSGNFDRLFFGDAR